MQTPVDLAEFRRLHNQGWGTARISRPLPHRQPALSPHPRQLGLKPHPMFVKHRGKELTKFRKARKQYLKGGITIAQAAKVFGLTEGSLRGWMQRQKKAAAARSDIGPSPREALVLMVGWPGSEREAAWSTPKLWSIIAEEAGGPWRGEEGGKGDVRRNPPPGSSRYRLDSQQRWAEVAPWYAGGGGRGGREGVGPDPRREPPNSYKTLLARHPVGVSPLEALPHRRRRVFDQRGGPAGNQYRCGRNGY